MAVDRQPAAEGEHRDLAEHRDRLQRRGVPRLEADQPDPRAVQVAGGVGEVAELAVLLAEALHDPHAGDGFVDHAGHLAGALLGVPGGGEDVGAQPQRDAQQQRQGDQRHQRERRREDDHHDERDHEHHDVAEHDRQERQQALDQPEVAGGARHQLAGLHLVVAGEVEALQALVDRVAQVVLHVEAHPAADPAPDVGGGEREDAGQRSGARATAPAVVVRRR